MTFFFQKMENLPLRTLFIDTDGRIEKKSIFYHYVSVVSPISSTTPPPRTTTKNRPQEIPKEEQKND
jgi:hypothetical protein